MVIGAILIAPFLPLLTIGIPSYFGAQSAWRRFRFPYDLKPLKAAICAAYPDQPGAAASYLSGVLCGYFENTEEILGSSQNPALMWGRNDGGKLRREELAIGEIPTRHGPVPEHSKFHHGIRRLMRG